MYRTLRVIIMLTLGLLIAGCGGETIQTPEAGKVAPDFELNTLDGETIVLSELFSKPVLVNFWATWCGPCAYEMPYLQQFYNERQGEVVLLTINIQESPSQVSQFMQSQGLSLPVLLDSAGEVAQRYDIKYIPSTFFIDKNGIIQEIKVGAFQSQAEIENSLGKLD